MGARRNTQPLDLDSRILVITKHTTNVQFRSKTQRNGTNGTEANERIEIDELNECNERNELNEQTR